jgi:hypothetical protein
MMASDLLEKGISMDVLISVLNGAPLWVWGVLIYLIFIGIRSSKTYTISLAVMPILPTVLFIWLISDLFEYEDMSLLLLYFIIGLIVGVILGFYFLYQKIIDIDRKANTITFEGTWMLLALLMIIFMIKYAFGYMNAVNHPFIVRYSWLELVVSGFISGIFIGRLSKNYYRYFTRK